MTKDHTLSIEKPSFISSPIQNMIAEMSTGSHSFLKQLCIAIKELDFSDPTSNDFTGLVGLIECLLQSSPTHMQEHWTNNLHSFDNRKLFQSIAELISIGQMVQQGWSVDSWYNDCIRLTHPTHGAVDLLVLSLILERDLSKEAYIENTLRQRLNQLDSDFEIGVTLRMPLSDRTNVDNIVAVTKKWLTKMNASSILPTDSRKNRKKTGYYKDSYTHIDFSILGRKQQPKDNTVGHILQPVIGRKMHHSISKMLTDAVEQQRQQREAQSTVPILISVVSNQSLQLSERAWKFLLYGVPKSETKHRTDLDTRHFGGWFQDPFRTFVSGLIQMEHRKDTQDEDLCFKSISFENPWGEFTTQKELLPYPKYSCARPNSSISTTQHSWTISYQSNK